ncbi:chemotaxis protein CheD [Fulvivirga lutimaris]|uniref:chemotaxis protein CheD n=1 Tax=Fulvivirga lutimaris TaxID=1819566 RepID=UPI001C871FAB|nr:chemotaxis protein CheD [Fulvivirga lutimaris]
MNHYMLPWWDGKGLASPKYGNIAIEQLIERMMAHGSRKEHMVAKIFGGAQQHFIGLKDFNVGAKNIITAEKLLAQNKISIIGRHTGGNRGRRIAFNTHTNQVFMKMIETQKLRKAI